jgi:hypothetical protein
MGNYPRAVIPASQATLSIRQKRGSNVSDPSNSFQSLQSVIRITLQKEDGLGGLSGAFSFSPTPA